MDLLRMIQIFLRTIQIFSRIIQMLLMPIQRSRATPVPLLMKIVDAESISSMYDQTKEFTIDKLFDSREKLIDWCRDVGKAHKTVVVIKKSVKKSSVIWKDNKETTVLYGKGSAMVLCCERSRAYQERSYPNKTGQKRKRSTGTRKCKCQFQLRGNCLESLKWRVKVNCGQHNHARAETLKGHPYTARLNDEDPKL